MSRMVALAQGKPSAEDWITRAQALAAADAVQLQLARKLSQRAIDIALRARQPDRAAGYEVSFALYQTLVGYPREAINRASPHSSSREGGTLSTRLGWNLEWQGISLRPRSYQQIYSPFS